MSSSNNYSDLIELLVDEMEIIGEMPSIYSDNYRNIIINMLLNEKESCIKSSDYMHLLCLVDLFRGNGEIFDLITTYMGLEEEDENKNEIAIKISNSIVRNALVYYRQSIEHDAESLYRRKYYATEY